MEKIEMIVKLTLARLEIIKLKCANGGYDWSMVSKDGKEQIENTLIEIDKLLLELGAGKNELNTSEPHLPLADVSGNEVEVCCKTCYFYDGNCSNPNICINHSEWKQTYR